MKPRIYPDTSVFGGVFDPEFDEWSKILFLDFSKGEKIAVISDLTLKELAPQGVMEVYSNLSNENMESIFLNDEVKALAQKYILENIVTDKYLLDAQHIALASIHRGDVLVSWNFKHIVNYNKIRLYNAINLKYGYPIIEIRSPREVI
jgi:hypothetical protein